MALSRINSQSIADGTVIASDIADGSITTAKIADANVTVAKLSATGTPDATTFLRGDGAWSAVDTTSISNGNSNVSVTSTDGNVTIGTAGTERVRVVTSGDVGIGTISPGAKLDVVASAPVVRITDTRTNGAGVTYGTLEWKSSDSSMPAGGIAGKIDTYDDDGNYGDRGAMRFYTNDANALVERMRITSGGALQFNSGYGSVATAFGCRAWVNFDGTTNVGGNCTIRASGNVSTVADNGTGKYTVNFTNAFPDANYTVAGSGAIGDAADDANILICAMARDLVTYSTTACAIRYAFPGIGANANFSDPLVATAIFHR
jgi:hypothetical protein